LKNNIHQEISIFLVSLTVVSKVSYDVKQTTVRLGMNDYSDLLEHT